MSQLLKKINTEVNRLNRNILECKLANGKSGCEVYPGLNRNILECKYFKKKVGDKNFYSLNRNILECK